MGTWRRRRSPHLVEYTQIERFSGERWA